MKLSIRLMGLLYGILSISLIGQSDRFVARVEAPIEKVVVELFLLELP